jgi:hypothetical protein
MIFIGDSMDSIEPSAPRPHLQEKVDHRAGVPALAVRVVAPDAVQHAVLDRLAGDIVAAAGGSRPDASALPAASFTALPAPIVCTSQWPKIAHRSGCCCSTVAVICRAFSGSQVGRLVRQHLDLRDALRTP